MTQPLSLQAAVNDVLAYLAEITAESLHPGEAQRRLLPLQARHREIGMELVWEEESYDHSLHYDVLVRPTNGTTVSVSLCRDRALPWPLRGVRRWSDANLVQVNGRMVTMEQAVQHLDVLWNEAPIMARMVETCLLREELEQRPIEVDHDELQDGMDGLRRAHRLYTAEDTQRWMQERGLTHERLEQLVEGSLACGKLRSRIAQGRVAAYFEAHRSELDIAQVARIECGDEDTARRLHALVADGERDLFEVAQRHFVATGAEVGCRLLTLRRREAKDELGAAVFAASPGAVIGPVRVGRKHGIARLLAVQSARQDEPTRALIEQILFDDWLAERRQAAKVTWHWGQTPTHDGSC